MSILPRLAIGSIQNEADIQPIVWALHSALEHDGLRTQTYLSRACFRAHHFSTAFSGTTPRYLDSWLMTPDICRQAFMRTAANADVSIVEGKYDQAQAGQSQVMHHLPLPPGEGRGEGQQQNRSASCSCRLPSQSEIIKPIGGSLDTLCQWLDLPRIAVVDVSLLNHCQLPKRPVADRLLLDRVNGPMEFCRWQTMLESLWGIPVVGALGTCSRLRKEIAALPANEKPTVEWRRALAEEFRGYSSLDRIIQLASRGGLAVDWATSDAVGSDSLPRGKVRVAVAYDDAFHCYFPDTLDMLELRGATVRVFSPLRDECLPPETDIVYLGCGATHEHAPALAENHCMLNALKGHVCSGRRIYAEGGGLAYLCQHVETADGQRTPLVGALRAVAKRSAIRQAPEPVEISLAVDSWLGTAGTKLRGYRNSNWQLEPTGCLTRFAAGAEHDLDLVGRHQAIGSRIHLNFAAQPTLLGGFLRPCPEALAWAAR